MNNTNTYLMSISLNTYRWPVLLFFMCVFSGKNIDDTQVSRQVNVSFLYVDIFVNVELFQV